MKRPLLSQSFKIEVFGVAKEIEAIYIKMKPGKIVKSVPIGKNEEAILDLDKNGIILGVELLEPVNLTIQKIRSISQKHHIKDVEPLKNINRLKEYFAVA